ncbi:MAG: hypothetical protein V3V28_10410 [Polaribacter sp.]|uniref:hypothetical protein n=1 Tax=Polaribacter sp. TaxID=1920175 RepID=UPI002F35B0B1
MKNIAYILFCFILFSCGNKQQKTTEKTQTKPVLGIVKEHKSAESIQPIFLKEVETWKELNAVNSFLKKFKKVSSNEALSNALELRDLVISLRDSVKPRIFDIPSFNARINILNNEVLRLADLTFIPAIKTEEVNNQIDKTITAFSAVNTKINTILSKKRFEDAIDINLDFIGIDSTKIDSISKKSINDRKRDAALKKRIKYEGPPVELKPIKKKNK